MKYDSIKDAAYAWVKEMNAFPMGMIERLFDADMDDWHEVTPIAEGCRVWSNDYQTGAEVVSIVEDEDGEKIVKIRLDDGEEVTADFYDVSREDDSFFPMWGWMWQFDDSADTWWIENNLDVMADCGFRIYESEEFGYFFGIDGAGYDFYGAHWIPLYKARGLQWHNSDN